MKIYRTEQNRTLLIQNISDHSQVAYENKYIIFKQFACDVLQQNDIHVHNSFRMLEHLYNDTEDSLHINMCIKRKVFLKSSHGLF